MFLRTETSNHLSANLLGGAASVLLIASAGVLAACNEDDDGTQDTPEVTAASGAGGEAGAAGSTPGGSSGTAGSTGSTNFECTVRAGDANDPVIDDLATDDFLVPHNGDRTGEWYSFSDGTAEVAVSHVPGSDGENYAIHIEGGPFESWGAGFGLTLNQPDADGAASNGLACAYDASAYTGISFSVKGSGTFRITVQSMDVVPPSGGGTCESTCYDAHTKRLEATGDWQQIVVPFRTLEQRGFGTPLDLDLANLRSIQFEVNSPSAINLTIDDISFVVGDLDPCSADADLPDVPDDAPYLDPSNPVDDRVDDLLERMSLCEKVGQMAQGEQLRMTATSIRDRRVGSVISGGSSAPETPSAEAWADLIDSLQEGALATRLAIPLLYGMDAVHGHAKVLGATVFPHNIGLAASRDETLAEAIGVITARELAATGVRWNFAPALSVARDDRWGRTFESSGEHPELATMMASCIAAQQEGAEHPVLTTAKHYVADGGTIWGTGDNQDGTPSDRGDVIMGEAALRAIHLAPYLDAIDAGVGAIMPSLSSWNGGKLTGNRYLLDMVLRQELGFDGILISDWDAIKQLRGSFTEQIAASIDAGVDVFMLPDDYGTFIDDTVSMVEEGRIAETRIDDSVRRILKKKFELGLFEEPYADRTLISTVGSDAHREVAREAVRESLVLLENEDGFLPLSTDSTVCINGSGADDVALQAGGWTLGWQYATVEPEGTSIAAALADLVGDNVVESGCDVGIRVVTESLGTYAEWQGDDADPSHDDSGNCEATDGCVVVIIAGRPVNVEALLDDPDTKAVVMAWYPGTEGGGVVDVLYAVDGQDFVGRLPLTWNVDDYDEPVNFCTASPFDTTSTMAMCGDVGEHYTDTAAAPPEVLFPYGYGLSY